MTNRYWTKTCLFLVVWIVESWSFSATCFLCVSQPKAFWGFSRYILGKFQTTLAHSSHGRWLELGVDQRLFWRFSAASLPSKSYFTALEHGNLLEALLATKRQASCLCIMLAMRWQERSWQESGKIVHFYVRAVSRNQRACIQQKQPLVSNIFVSTDKSLLEWDMHSNYC